MTDRPTDKLTKRPTLHSINDDMFHNNLFISSICVIRFWASSDFLGSVTSQPFYGRPTDRPTNQQRTDMKDNREATLPIPIKINASMRMGYAAYVTIMFSCVSLVG